MKRERNKRAVFPKLWSKDEGISAVEYGLLASLIAMGIIIALVYLGANVKATYDNIAKDVENATKQ